MSLILYASFTFHYASTLSVVISGNLAIYIYLHSTMLLLYPAAAPIFFAIFLIYIPLCFYFIRDKETHIRNISTFTFHYASTLSRCDRCSSQKPRQYLHSTMLLLYRCSVQRTECELQIYIPLCFYFIEAGRSRTGYPLCFYFIKHYSTLTDR